MKRLRSVGRTRFAKVLATQHARLFQTSTSRDETSASGDHDVKYALREKYICWSGTCRSEFTSTDALLLHQYERDHVGFQCCACASVFRTRSATRRHVKVEHLLIQETFTCPKCAPPRCYATKHHLLCHELRAHGVVKCDACAVEFESRQLLTAHRRIAHATEA